jgi:hypothetical protein
MSNYKYEKIRDSLKESGKLIYWYDSKGKLLVTDSSKKESRKKLLKTGYEGDLYRLSITFHTGERVGQGGPIAIHCRTFKIEDGEIQKVRGYKNGIIWFEKDWLITMRKWQDVWLNIIIKKLLGNFKFGIGIKTYPI